MISAECGKTSIRNAGKQEKARTTVSWFPAFLIIRVLAAAELR
jgi:hypothetical protein